MHTFPSSVVPTLTGTQISKIAFKDSDMSLCAHAAGCICAHVSFDSWGSISAAPVVMETVERCVCMCVSGRPSNSDLFLAHFQPLLISACLRLKADICHGHIPSVPPLPPPHTHLPSSPPFPPLLNTTSTLHPRTVVPTSIM